MLFVLGLGLFIASSTPVALVTGAGGRTGSLVYAGLKARGTVTVRAFVRSGTNLSTVQAALHCTACDEAEGIYYGDVTNASTLTAPFSGVDMVAIAVGVSGDSTKEVMEAVEFKGVEAQVKALVSGTLGLVPSAQRVVLCSSMGTTNPNPAPFEGGKDLFWKLQAETFLASCGVPAVVVKPGGLGTGPGNGALLVDHDDNLLAKGTFEVDRVDVARVMVAALFHPTAGLRFDLAAAKSGPPTTDLDALLQSARWSWQQ